MTPKMTQLLSDCFEARIRELEVLKSVSKDKIKIEKEIQTVKEVLACHVGLGIFKI